MQTIVELTAGRVGNGGGIPPLVLGQSVTIREGPFNSLTFSWQRAGALGAPVSAATGRVFLLDREYAGRIADLSPAVEGFVAVSASVVSAEYVFDSAIVVQPNTRYWFYSNDQQETLYSSNGNQDLYPDGEMYASNTVRFVVFYPFGRGTERVDANFVLRGRPVSR